MPVVSSESISTAWQNALDYAFSSENSTVENLIVSIQGLQQGQLVEDPDVRAALDAALTGSRLQTVRTVAGTIFPSSLWRRGESRDSLYARYGKLWPRIRAYPKNRRGTYFQRLIGYPEMGEGSFNQLEQVISTYRRGNRRRSALQASVIVPRRDLTNARRQGFPCMQQVAFIPHNGLLSIIGFYPTQYLFERAYGNYLGLINLGRFVAHEMELTLSSATCVTVVAKVDRPMQARRFRLNHQA